MTFMFKVAILIEAIRSNCGGEWARFRRWFPYFVLIRVPYSRSTPRPFPSHSSAFSNFIFLFRDGVCPGSSVLGSSSGGLVAPSAGTACSLSSPSVLSASVTISCLVPSSPCVFACRGRAVRLVGLSTNVVISASTVITSCGHYRLWSRLALRPRPGGSDHAFVGEWGPVVPHQYQAGCLWASGRRQQGKIPMPDHAIRSCGQPQFDCQQCRAGCGHLYPRHGPMYLGRI